MKWQLKRFDELSIKDLYEVLKLRSQIFVVEQNCIYQDLDNKDKKSYHLFCKESDEVVASLRILDRGISYDEVSIGRVVVNKNYRGQGLARKAMLKAISFVEDELKEQQIRISGQRYLVEFYKSLGFKEVSEVYLEDGIEHVEMLYTSGLR